MLNFGISGIVARIESGTVADDAFDDIFDAYLAPYHGMKADGIVLGCTHYIFIARAVERYFKKHFCGECRLFDGNSATVRQLGRVLEQSNPRQFHRLRQSRIPHKREFGKAETRVRYAA